MTDPLAVEISGNNLLIGGYPGYDDCGLFYVIGDDPLYWYSKCRITGDTIFEITSSASDSLYYFTTKNAIYQSNADASLTTLSDKITNGNFIRTRADANYLYILNEQGENSTILKFEKASFAFVDTFPLDLQVDQLAVDFVLLDQEEIILLGESPSTHESLVDFRSDQESSVFLKKYQLKEVNQFLNYDVGISEIRINETPKYTHTICPIGPTCDINVSVDYQEVFITLTNYGTETITSVNVNAMFGMCDVCRPICTRIQYFTKKYDQLNLRTQESIELSFGPLNVENQTQLDQHELCFWTSIPNNRIDKNTANDLTCKQFDLVLSTDEPNNNSTINYDPIANHLNLSDPDLGNSAGNLAVYDVLGRVLIEEKISKGSNEISIPFEFPMNVYFAVYKTEHGAITYKFVNN